MEFAVNMNSQSNMTQAEHLLLELRKGYIDELPSKFELLEHQILSFQTSSNLDQYADFCRNVHSLKGSSGTYGLNIVGTICHQLEDQMRSLNMGETSIDSTVVDIWLELIDLMRFALRMIEEEQVEIEEVEDRLIEIQNRFYPNDLTALLVNSSDFNTNLCENILEDMGVRVVSLTNGYVALGRLLEQKFDLLVTSNEVEGLCGRSLVAALKLNPGRNQTISQILITSKNELLASSDSAPDYVILRDEKYIENLTACFKRIVKNLKKAKVEKRTE